MVRSFAKVMVLFFFLNPQECGVKQPQKVACSASQILYSHRDPRHHQKGHSLEDVKLHRGVQSSRTAAMAHTYPCEYGSWGPL